MCRHCPSGVALRFPNEEGIVGTLNVGTPLRDSVGGMDADEYCMGPS